jgi:hypothetical protein
MLHGKKKALGVLAASAIAAAGVMLSAGGAHAAPTTVTAVTHISDRPDGGNGGTWAYDTFDRTLTVTVAADQSGAAPNTTLYNATVADSGTFSAVQGALTPNQATAGLKISRAVDGTMTGGITYTIVAPSTDTLTGTVPAAEDDLFSTASNGFVSTGDWPKQAFATAVGVTVTEASTWSWTYKTACEQWVDAASNNDGNNAADGNIHGNVCVTPPPPPAPFVLHGQWTSRTAATATVTWDESAAGWPSENKCQEVYITGFGFGPLGDFTHAHVGFTCDNGTGHNTGYLRGLKPDHTYALQIVPATGTYGSHAPIPGAPGGYVDVFTLADF